MAGSGQQGLEMMLHLILGFFNPELQTKKFDPKFEYIKRWVPEFGTKKYAQPIVEHAFARERVLKVFKEALASS